MKLILIHGNALSAISRKISEFKQKFDSLSITEINGKESSFHDAVVKLSTGDLFSESRLVILEQFDEKIDISKLPDDKELTVVLKYPKPLTEASQILKNARTLNAQIIPLSERDEISVFPFLDALADKNSQKAFTELDKLYAEYGAQYLLTMIFYLFRKLVIRPKKAQQYAIDKVNKQKRNFDIAKVTTLYKFGIETDFKIKSGLLEEKMGLTMLVERILAV